MHIIHISDTHIGKNNNQDRFDRLLEDLKSCQGINLAECVVIHTGDLVKDGEQAYWEEGREALDKLAGLVSKLFLCPGNHDCGGFFGVSQEKSDCFREMFADYLFHDQPQEFPVIHTLNEKHVLIGLDTNEAEVNQWYLNLGAEGKLGHGQCAKLERVLDRLDLQNKQLLVYLHHHPFLYHFDAVPVLDSVKKWLFYHLKKMTRRFRRMKDAEVFCQMVANKADVIVYGHKHEGLDCSVESQKYGIPLALDAGSTTDSDDMSGVMEYRIIALNTLTYETRRITLQSG